MEGATGAFYSKPRSLPAQERFPRKTKAQSCHQVSGAAVSLEYIRRTYCVPAKRGTAVRYQPDTSQPSKSNEWTPEQLAALRAAEARFVECDHDFGPPNQFGTTHHSHCQKCGKGWWQVG